MSIISGYKKIKNRVKDSNGDYQLISQWTSSSTVEMNNGDSLETAISGKASTSDSIKNITRSGTTFTATRADNTTFTFDQQDSNTWRPVQNNLTSDSTTDCLSAKQGKVLKKLVDGKQDASTAITTSNIGSQSVNYANSAGSATDSTKMPSSYWHWSGQGGQPTWLWGGDNLNSYYVYNPANFSVNYASSAGNASTWGGYSCGISTNNSSDTWLLVANGSTIQHRTVDSVISSCVLKNTSSGVWSANTLGIYASSETGLITSGKGSSIWTVSTSSDERLKENIKDTEVQALDIINKIPLRSFDYKDEKYGNHQNIGYVAQEIKDIIPEIVFEVPLSEDEKEKYNTDWIYHVEDKPLIKYLVKAIQELTKKIEILENKEVKNG